MTTEAFDALLGLLAQEEAIYTEMADLLEREQKALGAMAAGALGELAARKETLALRVKALDESRRVLARRLGASLGLEQDQVTISRLATGVGGDTGRRLTAAGVSLRGVVERCRRLNEANGLAARRGLDLIAGAARWLVEQSDPAGPIWRPGKAGAYGAPARGRSLITRKA